jgi:hypothetical protein
MLISPRLQQCKIQQTGSTKRLLVNKIPSADRITLSIDGSRIGGGEYRCQTFLNDVMLKIMGNRHDCFAIVILKT